MINIREIDFFPKSWIAYIHKNLKGDHVILPCFYKEKCLNNTNTYQAMVFCKRLAERMREVSLHMELLPLLWSDSPCLAASQWPDTGWWVDLSPLVATHLVVARSSPPCTAVVHHPCGKVVSPLCSRRGGLLQSQAQCPPVPACLLGFWWWLMKTTVPWKMHCQRGFSSIVKLHAHCIYINLIINVL